MLAIQKGVAARGGITLVNEERIINIIGLKTPNFFTNTLIVFTSNLPLRNNAGIEIIRPKNNNK